MRFSEDALQNTGYISKVLIYCNTYREFGHTVKSHCKITKWQLQCRQCFSSTELQQTLVQFKETRYLIVFMEIRFPVSSNNKSSDILTR